MDWSVGDITASVVSVCALGLSAANFVVARRAASRQRTRQKREDRQRADKLLDETFDLLYGARGYATTRDWNTLQDAEARVRAALAIDTAYARAVEYEGHLFDVQKNVAAALVRYRRSISLDPKRARPHECVGRLLQGDEAIAAFERAAALEPDRAALPWLQMGKEHGKLGRPAQAEACYRRALALRPKYTEALIALGSALAKRGEKTEARRTLEAAVESAPRDVDALVALGQFHMTHLADDDEGRAWIERASKVDPADDYPIAMLAAIHADRGDADNALVYAKIAAALNPTRRLSTDTVAEVVVAMKAIIDRRDVDKPRAERGDAQDRPPS